MPFAVSSLTNSPTAPSLVHAAVHGDLSLRIVARERHNGGISSIGVTMARLYDHDGLIVTDAWIRTRTASYAIGEIRDAWTTRRQVTSGSRWFTAGLGAGTLLVLIGVAGASGWLFRNWVWLLATPVILLAAGAIGLLDPIAIYLEKRRHELWITVDAGSTLLWKANAVEVGKALRQIQRARERHREDDNG